MIDLAAFAIISAIAVLSSVIIFFLKDILHVVAALSLLFLANSLLFLLLGQPLLAVVQLFVLVGGIATFLFVGVASAQYAKFKHTRLALLPIVWVALFLVISYPLLGVSFGAPQQNAFGPSSIAQSIAPSIGIFYIIAVTMFCITLGSIALLKKLGGQK